MASSSYKKKKQEFEEIKSSFSALLTALGFYDKDGETTATDINNYLTNLNKNLEQMTSIDLLVEVLNMIGITNEKIVSWISKLLTGEREEGRSDGSSGLIDTIEDSIKSILLLNLKGLTTCNATPFLSDDLMLETEYLGQKVGGKGIELSLSVIDLFGTLKNNPTVSSTGDGLSPYYFDNDFSKTEGGNLNLYQSCDFNVFLWYAMNKGTWSEDGRKHLIWDNRVKQYNKCFRSYRKVTTENVVKKNENTHRNENLTKWFGTDPKSIVKCKKTKYYGYSDPIKLTTFNGEEKTVKRDFYFYIKYIKRGSNSSDSIKIYLNPNRYYKQVTIPGSGYVVAAEKFGLDVLNGVTDGILNINEIELLRSAINDTKKYLGLDSIPPKEDKENRKKFAKRLNKVLSKEGESFNKIWKKITDEAKSTFDKDSVCQYDIKFNKTIFQFNYDYIYSIKLFDAKTIVTYIINGLLGLVELAVPNLTLSLTGGVYSPLQSSLSNMIRKVVEQDDFDEDENCFYTFSNDEYNSMLEEYEEKKNGKYYISSTTNASTSFDAKAILNKINELNSTNNSANTVQEILTAVAMETTDTTTGYNLDMGGFSKNFIVTILKETVTQLVMQVLSPKVMFVYYINMKVMGSSMEDTLNTDPTYIIKQMNNVIFSTIRQVYKLILNQLFEQAYAQLKKMIALFIKKLLLEKVQIYIKIFKNLLKLMKNSYSLWKNLLKTFNIKSVDYTSNGTSNGTLAIDDVDYADIVKENADNPLLTSSCKS